MDANCHTQPLLSELPANYVDHGLWRPSACLSHSQHATGLLLSAQQVEDIHQPLHRATARRAAAMWVVSRLQLR